MAKSVEPFELLRACWRALPNLRAFLSSQPYLPREVNFDVPIVAGHDHRQAYGVQFREIPEPTVQLRAGRIEWDPIQYGHDHFVIRTRQGHWEGFGTGEARLSYVVQGRIAPGWLRLLRKVWPPEPRILMP